MGTWLKTSKSLPAYSEKVLLLVEQYSNKKGIIEIGWRNSTDKDGEKYLIKRVGFDNILINTEVEYWMPLPSLP